MCTYEREFTILFFSLMIYYHLKFETYIISYVDISFFLSFLHFLLSFFWIRDVCMLRMCVCVCHLRFHDLCLFVCFDDDVCFSFSFVCFVVIIYRLEPSRDLRVAN